MRAHGSPTGGDGNGRIAALIADGKSTASYAGNLGCQDVGVCPLPEVGDHTHELHYVPVSPVVTSAAATSRLTRRSEQSPFLGKARGATPPKHTSCSSKTA